MQPFCSLSKCQKKRSTSCSVKSTPTSPARDCISSSLLTSPDPWTSSSLKASTVLNSWHSLTRRWRSFSISSSFSEISTNRFWIVVWCLVRWLDLCEAASGAFLLGTPADCTKGALNGDYSCYVPRCELCYDCCNWLLDCLDLELSRLPFPFEFRLCFIEFWELFCPCDLNDCDCYDCICCCWFLLKAPVLLSWRLAEPG